MNRYNKYALRTVAGIVLFFLVLWTIAFAIITFKKASITEMAITQINKQVIGTVEIGDLSANFLRTFPNISVKLTNVSIRDSLWNVHQHDFLNAEKIFIRLELLSLVTGKPRIGKVIVENASIYLYTDECGYCNLQRTEHVAFKKGHSKKIPEFTFYNTRLITQNEFVNSYHDIEATYLDCALTMKDTIYDMNIDIDAMVHSLGFNLAKGSYLTNKRLQGDFHLTYYPKNKISIPDVALNIDDHPFKLTGDIFLHTKPTSYNLNISTEKVNYKKATGLLTQALQSKVDSFNIIQPIDVGVSLAGVMQFKAKPKAIVSFNVVDADMQTPMGDLHNCSFNGSFINQVDSLQLPGDLNSKMIFTNVNAEWSGIPVTSSLIEVDNLLNPLLKCHIQSLFALEDLNSLTESSTISFLKGNGILDVKYEGSLKDTVYPTISGSFSLTDADFKYIPRDLLFQNCSGSIEFMNEDVIINNLSAMAGNTSLMMSGKIIRLLALLNNELAQPVMVWDISTPDLNLNDFLSYVKPRAHVAIGKATRKNKIIKAVENIDRFLHDGTARMNISAGKMTYKNFTATSVAASVVLVENKVLFDDVRLHHAGGTASMNGSLINGHKSNHLTLNSSIEKVNIPVIFQAFDNFGQDAITYKNLKGQMSATINMTGIITDKATVAENSMKGTVKFSVKNGELINFEPAVKIAATAFKNRDFSQIHFGELTNTLAINGSAFEINKMEIRSNVVILFVEGIYDTKKGTDMSIQVPVSNLSSAENESLKNTGRAGVNVRLRAKTGDDGKLNISWDPFNKAAKQRKNEEKPESSAQGRK